MTGSPDYTTARIDWTKVSDLQWAAALNEDWVAFVWDFAHHPDLADRVQPGQEYHWVVRESLSMDDSERHGHAATLQDAQAAAEPHLRELSQRPESTESTQMRQVITAYTAQPR